MNAFKKLKIGTQLSLGFGMLTAFMLILAVVSIPVSYTHLTLPTILLV